MIELWNGSTTAQTAKHFSTLRTLIPVVDTTGNGQDSDFCTCIKQCIPDLKFLTDEIGEDEYKNDWFRLYQNSVSGGSHTVSIIVDGQEILVTDDTYGQNFNGSAFYGYMFKAYNIWNEHGYGRYKFILRNYDSSGNLVQTDTSPWFVLKYYTDREANGTVRIETIKRGSLRHGKKYYDLRMTGGARTLPYWKQQIRLPGKLKWVDNPTESIGVVENNLSQTRQQVFDTMDTEYDLEIYLVSADQSKSVIFDDLFANVVYVSDYNVYNWETYRNLRLRRISTSFQGRVRKRKSFTFRMTNEESKFEKYND